jgi:hypothetical protein
MPRPQVRSLAVPAFVVVKENGRNRFYRCCSLYQCEGKQCIFLLQLRSLHLFG